MIFFPAIDIQDGKVVRLKKGRKEECVIYADNPLATAKEWQTQGAKWLHIIDLDGAFNGARKNTGIISQISERIKLKIQIGGGIRSLEDAEIYLNNGVERVIIGTLAMENPGILEKICQKFPGKIGVSLDMQNNTIKTRGWVNSSGISSNAILPQLEKMGVSFLIYTDIERDGMRTGPNLIGLNNLSKLTNLPIVIAGGISSPDDLSTLKKIARENHLQGVISGKAIYENAFTVKEAVELLKD